MIKFCSPILNETQPRGSSPELSEMGLRYSNNDALLFYWEVSKSSESSTKESKIKPTECHWYFSVHPVLSSNRYCTNSGGCNIWCLKVKWAISHFISNYTFQIFLQLESVGEVMEFNLG